ncbi:MAG: Flp pilus assembly complex ATPase component TadA [Clostridium sp.]|nr:Flp pilus assembly complex ATPase component TadA [Clostridium sp.]
MNRKTAILKMKSYFPEYIGHALEKISYYDDIHEIRMRVGRPAAVVSFGRERFLTEKGSLTDFHDMCRIISPEDMDYSFRAICDHSIHSYKREISEGFITLEGGNRVGICATAVTESGHVTALKYVSGLNFRISGQALGCADELCSEFGKNPCSMLIIGAPMSGKTTVIRDMCRTLGRKFRISVIDERSEIGAVYRGIPQNDIGTMTDVFDGYPKAEGIMTAVRVMSPDILVCDEIGGAADCEALLLSANSGVKVIATAHGGSLNDLKRRRSVCEILESGIFERYAALKTGKDIGKVGERGDIK